MRRGAPGFVLPVVLGIILLASFLAVDAATDLGSDTLLATHRVLHQRAFEAAERGIVITLGQLRAGELPAASSRLSAPGLPLDDTVVEFTTAATTLLPAGFSAGRIVDSYHEIRSTGRSARAARVTLVQGVRRRELQQP
jgi:hypothetical protein